MKNACVRQWHTYMCTFAAGWGDCLHIYMYVQYIHKCVYSDVLFCAICLCHILECERVTADVLCLCLNQLENTHVGMSAVLAMGVCGHLCQAQSPGSWLMPCSC